MQIHNKFNFKMFVLLLKKQIIERFSFAKKGAKSFDFLGMILSLALTATMVGVFVFAFSNFVQMYTQIKLDGILDIPARQYEILSVGYFVIFIIIVVSGIGSINFSIFEGEDLKVLSALPVPSASIFLSKIIVVYIKQFFVALLTVFPLNMTFAIATNQGELYILVSLSICFLLPLIALAFSSLLALPFHYISKYISNRYSLLFVLITVAVLIVVAVYSQFLEVISQLIITGEIRWAFNEKTMTFIAQLVKWLVPANWFAEIALGTSNYWTMLIYILATTLVSVFLAMGVIRLLFTRATQSRIGGSISHVRRSKVAKRRGRLFALMTKEFNTIIRTPSYAFQYFSMAVVMPVMVYFCMGLGTKLVTALIFIDASFELAVFIVIMFGVLTNTFCATNISREGSMFYSIKAMPFTFKEVVVSKILFCFIVACVSSVASVTVLIVMKYVSITEAIFILISSLLLAVAQICFATRMDFNHPNFSTEEDGEVKESNNTISTIIVSGLIVTTVIGLITIYYSLFANIIEGNKNSSIITYISISVISIVLALASIWFLVNKLEDKYASFS